MPAKIRRLIEALACVWLMMSCTTTPKKPDTEPCYCGWVRGTDAAAPKVCAVWQKIWTSPERQPVLASAPSPACDLQACNKLFATTTCKPLELWPDVPAPAAQAGQQPTGCFCDFVAVDGHPGGDIACGVWKAGDRYLREYHFTKDCQPDTCASKPFRETGALCGGQFQKFFANPGS